MRVRSALGGNVPWVGGKNQGGDSNYIIFKRSGWGDGG